MEYEELLDKVGSYGMFQKIMTLWICAFYVGDAFVFMSYVFLTQLPDHWCRIPPIEGLNVTTEQSKSFSLPVEIKDGAQVYSKCQMYAHPYGNLTTEYVLASLAGNVTADVIGCQQGWSYDTSQYIATVSTEWDLVCSRRTLAATSQSVFMAGLMVGILLSGLASDRFGRRKVVLVSLVVYIGSPLVTSFSVNLYMFMALRFLTGLFCLAASTTYLVILTELVGPDKRAFVAVMSNYAWVLGNLAVAGLAFALRHWRHLQLTVALIPVGLLGLLFFLPESPRWLYTKGRRQEATSTMARIARWNGTQMPEDIKVVFKTDQKRTAYIWEVCKYPRLRVRTAIIFYTWFVVSLVYYGLTLNATKMGVNNYASFAASAAAELPSYVFCQLAINRLGRRAMASGTLITGAAALLCIMAVPQHLSQSWLMILLTSVGKFGVTTSFVVMSLQGAEIFPTVVRNSGFASASCAARIGGIIAPQMALLSDISKYIPFVTFGILTLVAGGFSLILPETANRSLPETLEDGENLGRKSVSVVHPKEMETLSDTREANYVSDGEI